MSTPTQVGAVAPYPVTPFDLAGGMLLGLDDDAPAVHPDPSHDFATAMRSVISRSSSDRQSFVSFSGGRDSSAVLALATDEARRHGRSDPVPVTIRVVGSAAADEKDWQELVVRHLELNYWIRIDVTEELGILGPVAVDVLRRHGLLYPANAYFHDLLARHTGGGVLLTGGGGDELLDGSYAHHHARVRSGDEPSSVRTAAAIATSRAAPAVYHWTQRVSGETVPWLRPLARRRYAYRQNRDDPAPVHGWAATTAPLLRYRTMRALRRGQDLIARHRDTDIVHPFLEPEVVAAALAQGGKSGLGGRGIAMRTLVGELLPDEVATRRTKASFPDAVWTPPSLDRLRTGPFVDVIRSDRALMRHIDVNRLQQQWRSDEPHFDTALMVHAAHLASA